MNNYEWLMDFRKRNPQRFYLARFNELASKVKKGAADYEATKQYALKYAASHGINTKSIKL